MMCHSVEVVRFLLTQPGATRSTLRPVSVNGRIASLKWGRPEYARELKARFGKEVDYRRRPSEDFASVTINYETPEGLTVIGEATTSWSFVGPGLRLSAELLGPEYSMSWNTLNSELGCFFSRAARASAGKTSSRSRTPKPASCPSFPTKLRHTDTIAEDRHFVRAFLGRETPMLTWQDGLEVSRS